MATCIVKEKSLKKIIIKLFQGFSLMLYNIIVFPCFLFPSSPFCFNNKTNPLVRPLTSLSVSVLLIFWRIIQDCLLYLPILRGNFVSR